MADETLLLDFEKLGGLVVAVAQDAATREVLMTAFMDAEAWEKTVETGYAHYHSRSRKTLWKKGETSGNVQQVREIRIDCDQDAVLLLVNQIGGAACHTGNRSCFHRRFSNGRLVFDPEPPADTAGGSAAGSSSSGGNAR